VIKVGGADDKFAGVRVIDAEVLVVTSRNEAMLHPPVALDGEGNMLKRHSRPCSTVFSAFYRVGPYHPFCATLPFLPLASLLGCKRIHTSRLTHKADRHANHRDRFEDKNMNTHSYRPEGK
jgi:hypothetical protein